MSAPATIEDAFAHCEALAREHYENFPVGRFVPRRRRRHVYALYAFSRVADDFADEPIYDGFRQQKLDEWEARLHAAYAGKAEGPIFVALAETVQALAIPKQLLLDLLSAFRQDTVKQRYASWDELLEYCRRSANPVGRLVLIVFDHADRGLEACSDAICTGLQLANHWQDVAIDAARGRIYVPEELMGSHGVSESDLRQGRAHPGFQALMLDLVERARAFFETGRPLCDRVGRELRFEMRLTWLGGSGILDRIAAANGDVFRHRPRWRRRDKMALAWRAWRWPSGSH